MFEVMAMAALAHDQFYKLWVAWCSLLTESIALVGGPRLQCLDCLHSATKNNLIYGFGVGCCKIHIGIGLYPVAHAYTQQRLYHMHTCRII